MSVPAPRPNTVSLIELLIVERYSVVHVPCSMVSEYMVPAQSLQWEIGKYALVSEYMVPAQSLHGR